MKRPKRLFPRRERPKAEPSIDPIRFAVGASVQMCREGGKMSDNDAIRRRVLDYAKEALEGGNQPKRTMVIDRREELLINTPDMFRLVFHKLGIDRKNLRQQEAVFSRIEKTLAEVLEN
jgi:hypothetical protein